MAKKKLTTVKKKSTAGKSRRRVRRNAEGSSKGAGRRAAGAVQAGGMKITPAELAAAEKVYTAFKWGLKPQEIVKGAVFTPGKGDILVELGELHAVEYNTPKGARGKETYRHVFGRQKPLLCTDKTGKYLMILGGAFRVRPEGITG